MRENISLFDFESLYNSCFDKLSTQQRQRPWDLTNHGRKLLETEDELNAYIVAYGEMHVVKCRAALQNFPFDDLNMSFEIVDWGCGQGLATLTLLQMLVERGKTDFLRCITLIEPSEAALKKAMVRVAEVKSELGHEVYLYPVNEFIPNKFASTEDDLKLDVQCDARTHICINLFSNILDLPNLNLAWLAQKSSSLANKNYMVCVGPNFRDNTGLADFCGYFSLDANDYFSNFRVPVIGYTSHTNHAFGCEAKCFVHRRDNIQMLNLSYIPLAHYGDENDEVDIAMNNNDNIRFAAYNAEFDAFVHPRYQGEEVDFVFLSKKKGVVLMNIVREDENLREAILRIDRVRDNLFGFHSRSLAGAIAIAPSDYGYVRIALLFPWCKKTEAENKRNELLDMINKEIETKKAHKKEKSSQEGKELQEEINSLYRFVETANHLICVSTPNDVCTALQYKTRKRDIDCYDELRRLIAPQWHSFNDGDPNYGLTVKQKSIGDSGELRQKVKGVAGCGKTQVVAYRAVAQHLKTGDCVLVVVFNITIIQYIKMRIGQVRADFNPNMFDVINYHQLFKTVSVKLMGRKPVVNKRAGKNDYDDVNYFEGCKDKIKRYKTIIVDEIQDFKTEWIQVLEKYFLEEGGTLTVLGDSGQNIYSRERDKESNMPELTGAGFPAGPWRMLSENVSMRIKNPRIASLVTDFAHRFNVDSELRLDSSDGVLLFEDGTKIEYRELADLSCVFPYEDYRLISDENYRLISEIISGNKLDARNVAVLGSNIDSLRQFQEVYDSHTLMRSMTTFETPEEYMSVGGDKAKLDEIRRAAKVCFTTDCDSIKISTIHSFKGWESDTVILILPNKNDVSSPLSLGEGEGKWNEAALVYTAITRAKRNLFIIGSKDSPYHKFFSSRLA